jgi:hypothetical protein
MAIGLLRFASRATLASSVFVLRRAPGCLNTRLYDAMGRYTGRVDGDGLLIRCHGRLCR